jgi:hypothetical protein
MASALFNVAISLTSRLPFDDDEFDLVRMNGLAKGIPEVRVCGDSKSLSDSRGFCDQPKVCQLFPGRVFAD